MKTGSKTTVAFIIAGLLIITSAAGYFIYLSTKSADYEIQNSVLKIPGMYGQDIPLSEISSVELNDTLPEILLRTNGSALGSRLKGNFKLKDIGAVKLFVDTSTPPFIFVKWNSDIIILNYDDAVKTRELYANINAEIPFKCKPDNSEKVPGK